jgi:hypothetical protein
MAGLILERQMIESDSELFFMIMYFLLLVSVVWISRKAYNHIGNPYIRYSYRLATIVVFMIAFWAVDFFFNTYVWYPMVGFPDYAFN